MIQAATTGTAIRGGPFDLDDEAAYRRWRDWKLDGYPQSVGEMVVEVRDPKNITTAEFEAMMARICRTNMALYAGPDDVTDKDAIRAVGRRFGLERLDSNMMADEDGITPLAVSDAPGRMRYVPYSNRAIHWHTDGYYNTLERQIYGLLLHCAADAPRGGENRLLDHEIAYIRLRDENPDHIAALMHPAAMSIPANTDEDGTMIREERTGPVFMFGPGGALHMRYTRRARNVVWRDDATTRAAVAFLESLCAEDRPFVFRHRMAPGQGLVSNNVLHDREGFDDDPAAGRTRLLYRARYFDRIAGTGLAEVWPG